jgi:transposase
MRPFGSPENLQKRRERAIQLLKEGEAPVEVARQLGIDRRSVRRWNASYRRQGIEGIHAKPAPGRPSRLSTAKKQRLTQLLVRGAEAAGFPTDLWTCPRVATLIRERWDISYHVDHVCRLLHSLGLSPQRPERRAIERDELQIQNWIRTDWPRAKKKPTG